MSSIGNMIIEGVGREHREESVQMGHATEMLIMVQKQIKYTSCGSRLVSGRPKGMGAY